MLIIEPRGGLTNRMRVIVSGLWLQEQLRGELVCLWLRNAELNAPFAALFEPVPGLVIRPLRNRYRFVQASENAHPAKKVLAKWINACLGVDGCLTEPDVSRLVRMGPPAFVEIGRRARTLYVQTCQRFGAGADGFRKFLPIAPIRQRIGQIVRRFTPGTIGIHVRRTDHAKCIEMSPTALFIQKMTAEIARNPAADFFLSTDDPAVEREMKENFGSRIFVGEKEFSRQTVPGMQAAVVDLYCLSKTSAIWGSYWSSFSDVAAQIGNKPLLTMMK